MSVLRDCENIILTRCSHRFHETCLLQAKERRPLCPLCRGTLTPVASTLTPVIYYELTIPVVPEERSGVSLHSRFEDLDEVNAPENPYREQIISTSVRVR
jgi:Ring finger domain